MTDTTKQNCGKHGLGNCSCACGAGHCAVDRERAARATPVSPAQPEGENTVFASLPDILANLEAAYRSGASGEYGGNAQQCAVAIMHQWDLPDAPAKPQFDLHSAIMNLPCKRADDSFLNEASRSLYKEGHRDARHAAAELVAASVGAQVAGEPVPQHIIDRITEYGDARAAEDGADSGNRIAAVIRAIRSHYTAPVPAPATVDADAMTRLRRVLGLLDIADPFPGDDAKLHEGMFSVLGEVARKIEGKAAPAAQAVVPDELNAILTRIDDAHENYERMGEVCSFEGEPMIYASTLHEIIELRGKYHAAPAAVPQGYVRREHALTALTTLRGYCATVIEDHAKDTYQGVVGQRPQDVAPLWATEIHGEDVTPYLDEAIADASQGVEAQKGGA